MKIDLPFCEARVVERRRWVNCEAFMSLGEVGMHGENEKKKFWMGR